MIAIIPERVIGMPRNTDRHRPESPLGKDLPSVSTNTYIVQTWDKHHLVAETSFYADKDGNETPALNTSTKFIFRVVMDFNARSVSKFIESNGRTIGYHLKAAP